MTVRDGGLVLTDTVTGKPIRVSSENGDWAHIVISLRQLDQVQAVLDRNRVSYWVDEVAVAWDGEPPETVVHLGRRVDPGQVQRLLDAEA